ncbi:hypothetical protein ACIODS_33290 [Micromonospora chalcea]|uniref:hypothetical protein n=1 Tax=Micromonospora chalcea TaxID=1874 RepID=UPI0037F55C8E
MIRDGVTYTWPNVRPGQPDNVIAQGQRLTVHSPPGATGTATIHFTDGTSQQVLLGFSDWTLAAGQRTTRLGTTDGRDDAIPQSSSRRR